MAERRDPEVDEQEQEASDVLDRRRDDLPSQRDINSPEAGRPPRGTEFEHPNKDQEI